MNDGMLLELKRKVHNIEWPDIQKKKKKYSPTTLTIISDLRFLSMTFKSIDFLCSFFYDFFRYLDENKIEWLPENLFARGTNLKTL